MHILVVLYCIVKYYLPTVIINTELFNIIVLGTGTVHQIFRCNSPALSAEITPDNGSNITVRQYTSRATLSVLEQDTR